MTFNPNIWAVYWGTELKYVSLVPMTAKKFADERNRELPESEMQFRVQAIPLETELK